MVFAEDNLRKKKKGQRKKILGLMVFLLILLIFGMNSIISILHQKKQISTLTQRIKEVEQKNETLTKEAKALKTNPSYIEDLARQIGMMRQGEKKVKFVTREVVESNRK